MSEEIYRCDVWAREVFELPLYEKQAEPLKALDKPNSRVAFKAANGSGKTDMIASSAAVWNAALYPKSITVCTSGVKRQVMGQLWPAIVRKAKMLDGLPMSIRDGQLTIHHPAGDSKIHAFTTDDPDRFEGWHSENLMMIVDEAKSVDDGIFQAVERCLSGSTPHRLLVLSSPGGTSGEFYRIFTQHRRMFDTFTISAYDCAHISRENSQKVIDRWGIHHPFVRSMIFGEFMAVSSDAVGISKESWLMCADSPPAKQPGKKVAGLDFAAGGDENVIAIIDGNKVLPLIAWVDKNTMSAVGRFVLELRKHDIKPENVYCDGGGLGKPMADRLEELGWPTNRVHFGSAAYDRKAYKNRITEAWMTLSAMIDKSQLIIPKDDEILIEQATTRRIRYLSNGTIELEPKDEYKERAFTSPDRPEALALAAFALEDDLAPVSDMSRPSMTSLIQDMDMIGASDFGLIPGIFNG